MRSTLITTAILALTATAAGAQGSEAVRLQLQSGSEISFTGTSSVRGFTCKTSTFDAQLSVIPAYASADLRNVARPIGAVTVSIPVRSLRCGNSGLETKMLKALKADQNATITFRLDSYEVDAGATTTDAFTTKAVGSLKIAGRERAIDLRVRSERFADGSVTARGEREILMSDFGITPPTMMLGTIRTGDKVVVKFNLNARPRAVANGRTAETVAP